MNAMNMEMLSVRDRSLVDIREFMPERGLTHAECGETFTQNLHLALHYRPHTGVKPCKVVNVGNPLVGAHILFNISDLTLERSPVNAVRVGKPSFKTHCIFSNKDRGRPYVCGVWKTFSQSSQLTPHRRVHPGEKQCKCNECRKAFCQSSLLIHHREFTLEKDPTNKCNECRKPLFRVHILLYIK